MALYFDGRQEVPTAEWMTRDEAIILGLSADSTSQDVARIAEEAQAAATEEMVLLHGLLTQLFFWRAQLRKEAEKALLRQEIVARQ